MSDFNYISREEWGPIPMKRSLVPFKPHKIEGIVFHHTTGAASDPIKRVKQHDRHHVHGRGWSTIAYNWLIGEKGEIIEGRGWNVGGATKNWNSKTVSISYVGSGDEITEAALDACRTVIDECRSKYGDLWIKSHRDFKPTYCPSDKIAAWVADGCDVLSENPKMVDWDELRKWSDAISDQLASKPLRRGSRGLVVTQVQRRLNQRGCPVGAADGIYGRKTVSGVKKFQRQSGIKQDGKVGPITWRFLWNS